MHFNSKATHGLRAVAVIATSPRGLPVTAPALAHEIRLSLSSMESIVSQLKKAGLIFAHRGPGGGYQLRRAIESLSVWDVVCHFHKSDLPTQRECEGPEGQAVFALAVEAEQVMRGHLQAWPLADVVAKFSPSKIESTEGALSRSPFNLKPLLQPRPPTAPSWVFDLAKFSRPAFA